MATHDSQGRGSAGDELHPVLRAAPQGVQIYRHRADGRLVLAGYNPAAESILGVAHADLVGLPVERCLPFVAGTDIPGRLAAVADGGHSLDIDRLDDGEGPNRRTFRLYAFPMTPGCAVLNILDVTGRRRLDEALYAREQQYLQAERALQESRDTAAAFVTHMPAGLILFGWDRGDQLVLLEANPAARRLFAGQIEGWLGRPMDEIWPLARGQLIVAMLEVMRTGRAFHVDEIATFAKPTRYFRVTAFALPGDRLAVTGEEITSQRQAATERARLEEQLRQAQRLESIGRLAGGVAHDFNNFLTGILGNVSLLRLHRGVDDPIYPTLLEIERATERAASLTRQLLAFSRKQVIEPRAIDLNSLLSELRRMLIRLLGEDIRLLFAPAKDLGPVRADPSQIEQLILNLAVNARDAMPDGGTLTFETHAVVFDETTCREHVGARPGAFVELGVSDTGSGMSEEVKARIFEPFFTTKDVGKGTGLGLAMVYGAVQQNQGFLAVSSEVGRGTTFKIYLPRASDSDDRPVRLDGRERLPGGSETILLVEDEPVVRDVAQRLLRELGYQVLPCPNADEALGCATEHGVIHLLLTDVVMPGRTGPELAAALRAVRAELRVLYCSGYADSTIGERGLLEPGIHYLAKPYTPLELAQKIREALGE